MRNSDGTITIPVRAEGEGGVVGDGSQRIGPDHPEFKVWDEYLKRQGD